MENQQSVICWIYGEDFPFAVDMNPRKTIYHLKEAIAEQNPDIFGASNPRVLRLFLGKITPTKKEMNKFACKDGKVLVGIGAIEEYFPGVLPNNMIHFVIQTPGKQHSLILRTHIC
jgi:hypothetical protein